MPPVRLELTAFRLWDWRAAYCATEAWYLKRQIFGSKNLVSIKNYWELFTFIVYSFVYKTKLAETPRSIIENYYYLMIILPLLLCSLSWWFFIVLQPLFNQEPFCNDKPIEEIILKQIASFFAKTKRILVTLILILQYFWPTNHLLHITGLNKSNHPTILQ